MRTKKEQNKLPNHPFCASQASELKISRKSFMPYAIAAAANLTKTQVWSIAESIAKQLDFNPGDDIEDLVNRIGGAVSVKDTLMEDPERSGSLYVDAPNKFRIFVPAHTSLKRDRFTIAHELGHYIIHYAWRRRMGLLEQDTMMALRKGSDRVEWEANWFAAAFLMPREAFTSAFQNCAGNTADLAAQFNVSSSAAEVRARQLDLI